MARTKTLELAVDKASALPEAAQHQIGRDLLEYVEFLAQLRAELKKGVDQLDAGFGEELDIDEFLRQRRMKYEGKWLASLFGRRPRNRIFVKSGTTTRASRR